MTHTLSPCPDYIGGEWLDGPRLRDNINPSDTRDVIGRYAQADAALAERAIAAAHEAAPAQIAIAWLLARGPDIVPIPGTKRIERLEENLGAARITLAAGEMKSLEAAFPVGVTAGARYPAEHLARVGI